VGPGSGTACDITLNTSLSEEERHRWQDAETIRRILRDTRTVAVVGLSTDSQKASSFVASYLQYEGYRIIPVTPKGGTLLGERTWPDLASVPEPIDLVVPFRPAPDCTEVARQAVAVHAKAFWLQLRLLNREAAGIAAGGGLDVVMDKCVKMEHGRFLGGLHWAGMNTELVSARRRRH
jgi:predicted CoA-binding protein